MRFLKFRKLGLGLTAICFLIVSLVFSTYAFVIVNKEVDVSSFSYDIKSDIGIWASLDGNNFSQDIESSDLISVIESNLGMSLDEFEMDGITPDADSNGKVILDSDGYISFKKDSIVQSETICYSLTEDDECKRSKTYFVANSFIKASNLEAFAENETYYQRNIVDFTTITFDSGVYYEGSDDSGYVISSDLSYDSSKTYYSFTMIDSSITFSSEDSYYIVSKFVQFGGIAFNDNVKYYEYSKTDNYSHEYNTVDKSNYITFDVYFKLVNISQMDSSIVYNLNLNPDTTSITARDVTVTPKNNLTTLLSDEVTEIGPTKDNTTLTLDPSNAIRLALYNSNYEFEVNGLESSDTKTNGLFIYEKSGGLGSSAIEDNDKYDEINDNRHNKLYNAMYTYYNSTYPLYPFSKAATYNESFVTNDLSNLSDDTTVLGTFTYNNDSEEYNIIKLKISIYLEGWDADFLTGIASQSLSVALGFKLSEVKSEA